MYIVGIDIGGTFTDLMAINLETQEQIAKKTLTTPSDPSVGVMRIFEEMIEDWGISGGEVENVIHGTTLVTNTVIEKKGAKTALITTKGFRDVLEIGRESRYELYDWSIEIPKPIVPRNQRFEVEERILGDGSILIPLDSQQAESVVDLIKSKGVGAVAICLLHAYINDSHEAKLKELVAEKMPSVSISLSSECVPEIREFERMSTTVINAYTQPITKSYLSRIQESLNGLGYKKKSYFVMLSSGGITTREVAEKFPCRILESGPAAGAILASFQGTLKNMDKVISFDMGGTTAKICLIEDGKPFVCSDFEAARIYRFKKGSGYPIRLPVIDMIEIGAGGGSIARIDDMGLLKVGPESAGSDPGPICYDLGGEEPTVTDADLLLGYLNPDYFLGGKMALNLEKTRKVIKEKLADPLGIDVTKAAWGIRRVVDENMANATRVYAVEKGLDYKAFSMIAFGGQGPNHGFTLAKLLSLGEIVIPMRAGVASALGFLVSPIAFDLVRTNLMPLQKIETGVINSLLEGMEEEGKSHLKSAGVREGQIQVIRTCDMRYVGQGHEIAVGLPLGRLSKDSIDEIYRSFTAEYEKIYHRTNPLMDVEGLNWRVTVVGPRPVSQMKKAAFQEDYGVDKAIKGRRKAYSPDDEAFIDFQVFDRYRLKPGMRLEGPAIVEETESTSIIGPGAIAEVDEYENLVIKTGM
jgi:N-methylhydantoinase A